MVALALVFFAADALRPAPLTEFDGRSWSQVQLNRDTDAEIKRRFRTEKGAVRPEALKVVTERPKDVRVDALLDGRGGKATVRALRVEYSFDAPTLPSLQAAFGEEPVDYYLEGRNDDWHLAVFRAHNLLAFVPERGPVSTFYLATPEGLGRVLTDYSDKRTPVVPVIDPGERWDRTVLFGDTSIGLYVGDNAPGDFDDSTRRRIRDGVRDILEDVRGRQLRFESREMGTLTASLRTGKFSSDGTADGTVALSLETRTPYGRIQRSVSRTRKIRPRYKDAFLNLADDALEDLKNDVAQAVRRLGPPSPDQTREDAMQRLYGALTG